MKLLKTLMALGLILFTTEIFGQDVPDSYQTMFNNIVTSFKTIRGANSITKGQTILKVISDHEIALRIKQKKQIKNLTFITKKDEENNPVWIAANQLTIDMVNKYQKDLTKILDTMSKLAEKKSQE